MIYLFYEKIEYIDVIEGKKRELLDFIQSDDFFGYYMFKPEAFLKEDDVMKKAMSYIKDKIGLDYIKSYMVVDFSNNEGKKIISEMYSDKRDNKELFNTLTETYSNKMFILIFKKNENNDDKEYGSMLEYKGKKWYYDDNGDLKEGWGIRGFKKPGENFEDRVNNLLHCPDFQEEAVEELKEIIQKARVLKIVNK